MCKWEGCELGVGVQMGCEQCSGCVSGRVVNMGGLCVQMGRMGV